MHVTKKINRLARLFASAFDPSLDLHVQAFNLLTFSGMASGVFAAISAFFTEAGILNIIANLFTAAVALFCLLFAWRTGKYRLCYFIAVIAVFLIGFSLAFFTAGGYRSGMPCFFVFAIVFTALMLDGKSRIAFIIIEFALYVSCILTAYFVPQSVVHFATELDAVIDVLVGIAIVSLILLFVVLLYIRIYDNRQKQLIELDRLKTEFYQDMHHEMKTPLAVIISDINNADDMLSFDIDKATVHEKLEHAQEEIMRLASLIDHSLHLATVRERGRTMQLLNYAQILQKSTTAFSSLLATSQNTLTIQILDGMPDIMANEELLRQVISNLLFNANKHTKGGNITISLQQDNAALITSIQDDGEGMEADLLDHILERGVSTDSTGLGLAICKTIVELHGGSIWIKSELGKGTLVQFSLPCRSGNEPQSGDADKGEAQ